MKIRRIKLHNLNSLRGEHEIDLTREPLASAGLFAITGPTGAGKSTLLDAVTLALYGRAARYGSEPNPDSMMSRHCGECTAEVEFSVPKGIFRAVWQLRRARGKADGRMQPPQRYVYDSAGQVLAQQIREADGIIEELVGLDYDRFLRSVLLAQGEFARFLKASRDERAELLESLTGTVIYSELGVLAHKEASQREAELQIKAAALDQIKVLTDEEREEIKERSAGAKEEKQKLQDVIEARVGLLLQIERLETAVGQEAKVIKEQETLAADRVKAEADLGRLERYHLTSPFLVDLIRFHGADEMYQKTKEKREDAESTYAETAQAFDETTSLFRRTLDHAIAEEKVKVEDAQKSARKAAKEAAKAREWLETHATDAGLADQLTDLATALAELKSTRRNYAAEWADLRGMAIELGEDAVGELPESSEALEKEDLETMLDDLSERLENEQKQSGDQRAVAEKRLKLCKDHLNKVRLVADLGVHRSSLADGEPCPLCGATEHPYAEGHEPDSSLAEIEEEVSRAEAELETWKQRAGAVQRAGKEFAEIRPKIVQAQSEWTEAWTHLTGAFEVFSLELPSAGEEDDMRKALQKRLNRRVS